MGRRLIWLIIPHTGKKKVRGESNHLLYEDLARYLAAQGDYIYFLVPEWVEDKDLKQMNGVFYIRVDKDEIFFNDMAWIDHKVIKMFERRGGSKFVDVVITSKPAIIPQIAATITSGRTEKTGVIYLEPGADDKFKRIQKADREELYYLTLLGYATSYSILLTENEKRIALEHMKTVFSPSVVAKWLDRAIVNPVGVPIDILDKYKTDERYDKFTLFFGARVNDVKNVKDIVDIYDLLYRSGRQVAIKICTSTPEALAKKYIGMERLIRNRDIELYTDMSREEYLKIARKAHVFVAWSKREGFPVGFWEQMYLGIIGIFRATPWALSQLPKDYPYIVKTKEQAYALIKDIYDNYEKHREQFKKYEQMIRERYSKDVIYNNIRNLALRIVEKARHGISKDLLPPLLKAYNDMPDTFTIDAFIKQADKYTKKKFPVSRLSRGYMLGYPNDYQLHLFFLEQGADFYIVDGEVVYVKPKPI